MPIVSPEAIEMLILSRQSLSAFFEYEKSTLSKNADKLNKNLCKLEIEKGEIYFTDKEYEYGCFPFYLNYMIYDQVAQQIIKEMEKI